MSIASRLAEVRERIRLAAEQVGRAPESVQLVAVSKHQPSSAIREAYAAGQRLFGENYAQELTQKSDELADLSELAWHFIGHAQRNKARDLARTAHLVQTVDRLELAEALSRKAERSLPILIEVNLGHEPQKAGCFPEQVKQLVDAARDLPLLDLRGLMTIPPAEADPAPFFEQLGALSRSLREGGSALGPELSMGMSADFELAVHKGATLVRVGTAIFGARQPALGAA